jgi:ubiquinol-cytochrome c reductase cytochrome b subunit
MVYPFIEAWVTGDKREHHIAERPRNNPTRTAIGAAGVTFYAVLWAGASSDIIATHFRMTIEGVILTLQILLIVGPVIAFTLAKRMALALQRKDRELVLHGYESSRIVRLPGGEYREIHTPLDEFEQWKLVSFVDYEPEELRPNARGKITVGARLRSSVSKFYFEDRIAPVTTKELESVKH